MENLQKIKENPFYKMILSDSFGGVMYNIANRDKYDTIEILRLWNLLSENEKESAWGIMKWAINFIQWK